MSKVVKEFLMINKNMISTPAKKQTKDMNEFTGKTKKETSI